MAIWDDPRQLAAIDAHFFGLYYVHCPNCGLDFDTMHPEMNIVPHWNGDCKRKEVLELERIYSLGGGA